MGRYVANDNGLFDMIGNVWEWTCSQYNKEYGGSEGLCEKGPSAGRALRGGSWDSNPSRARSADRNRFGPATRDNDLGFRVFQDVR